MTPTFNIYRAEVAFKPIGTEALERRIKNVVEAVMGISFNIFSKKSRLRELVISRQLYCYLLYKYTNLSLEDVAKKLDAKNPLHYSTIIHSRESIEDVLETVSDKFHLQVLEAISMMRSYREFKKKQFNGYYFNGKR